LRRKSNFRVELCGSDTPSACGGVVHCNRLTFLLHPLSWNQKVRKSRLKRLNDYTINYFEHLLMVKKIFLKLVVLLLFVAVPYLFVKFHYVRHWDGNYYKTTGKANHLILGLSRAKRGLVPSVFEKELNLEGRMINFAFNNMESPYGPEYFAAVQRKVVASEKNGVFILSVSPGAILEFGKYKKGEKLREESFFFYDLWCQTCEPNLEYILKSPVRGGSLFEYFRKYFKAILQQQPVRPREIPHKDGWGELQPQLKLGLGGILNSNRQFDRSSLRESYLEKTIAFLQQHGQVSLLRLPITEEYQNYEEKMLPAFDSIIQSMADKYEVDYFNFLTTNDSLLFIDGHHLAGEGAREISTKVAKDIQSKFIH
jgi:hypothetical protein